MYFYRFVNTQQRKLTQIYLNLHLRAYAFIKMIWFARFRVLLHTNLLENASFSDISDHLMYTFHIILPVLSAFKKWYDANRIPYLVLCHYRRNTVSMHEDFRNASITYVYYQMKLTKEIDTAAYIHMEKEIEARNLKVWF